MSKSRMAMLALVKVAALAALLCAPGIAAAKAGDKPARLVLMPLKVAKTDRTLAHNLEAAFIEGLSQHYEVYAGERVIKAARAAQRRYPHAAPHSRSRRARRQAVRSMREVAATFHARLVARADAIRDRHDYLIALLIQDSRSGRAVYSRSFACEGCGPAQAIDRIKQMLGMTAAAPPHKDEAAADGKTGDAQDDTAHGAADDAEKELALLDPAGLPLPGGRGPALGGLNTQADYLLTINRPVKQVPRYRCNRLDVAGDASGALRARVACRQLNLALDGDARVQFAGGVQRAEVQTIRGNGRADLRGMEIAALRVRAIDDKGVGYFTIGQDAQVATVNGTLYVRAARGSEKPAVHIGVVQGAVHWCGVRLETDDVRDAGTVVEDCAW